MERAAGSAGKDRLHQGGGGPRKGHSWEGTPPRGIPGLLGKIRRETKTLLGSLSRQQRTVFLAPVPWVEWYGKETGDRQPLQPYRIKKFFLVSN